MSVPQDKKSYFSYEANGKFLGLEVLRFISTLSVLIWHYQHFYGSFEFRVGYRAWGLIWAKSSFPAIRNRTVRIVAKRL